jgi:hypothetical protein
MLTKKEIDVELDGWKGCNWDMKRTVKVDGGRIVIPDRVDITCW